MRNRVFKPAIFISILAATILVMLARPGVVYAASFNDAAIGNWNDGATWGNTSPGVEGTDYPGQNDDVTIDSHTVTLTATQSCKSMTISGGTLTMGANNLNVVGGNWTYSSGTFNEDTGTVTFTGAAATIDIATTETFNNLTINKTNNVALTIASGDTLVVAGTLTLTDGSINTGTIDLNGTLDSSSTFDGGTATILINDGQTVTLEDGAVYPGINLQSGTLNAAGTNTIAFGGLTIAAGGTFNHNNGTIVFSGATNITVDVNTTETFNNLTINKTSSPLTVTIASGDTLVVAGTLALIVGRLNTGTIDLNGTLDSSANWQGGTATILINDGQTVTLEDGAKYPGFNLQSGTLNASGTNTIGDGPFTIASGATFNHNNGTIVFAGCPDSGQTVDVDTTETFNNFTINKDCHPRVLTIASGDTLVVNGTLTLTGIGQASTGTFEAHGAVTVGSSWAGGNAVYNIAGTTAQTLTGTTTSFTTGTVTIANTSDVVSLGAATTITTLTIASNAIFNLAGYNFTSTTFTNNGTLQLQGGETVSTPTNNAGSTVEYTDTTTGQTIKDWTYKSLKINGSGQTFSLGAGETLGENLTVTAGTFDVNDQTLSINGNTVINGGTMKTGTGVVTFGNASGDTVTISSGGLQIESDATNTDIVKTAGTWTNSGGTITYNAGSTVDTKLLSALSPYNNLTINSSGSTYTLDGVIDVNGNLTITAGTADVSSSNHQINVAGNWSNSGTLTPRAGTVVFDGTNQTFTGSTSFHNFSKTESANDSTDETLTFDNTATQTIGGLLTLDGRDSNDRINLVSNSPGTAWELVANGTFAIDYIDVADSNASGGSMISLTDPTNCVDSGGNTNWGFDTSAPSISLTALSPDPNTDNTPSVTGTATEGVGTVSNVQYQMDATSGTWTACTADDGTFDEASEAFTCTPASALSDGSHTMYVRATDSNGNTTSNANAATDTFTIDTTAPASFDLDNPGDNSYTKNERPTFKWKAASTPDATSGLSKYKLEIDNGDSGDFSIDDIPVSRTTDYSTNKYLLRYENFSDADNSNNYISVHTKSSSEWGSDNNDGRLKEGKRYWKVTAVDNAGNTREEANTLFVDRSGPGVEVSQVNNSSTSGEFLRSAQDKLATPEVSLTLSTTDKTPTIYGKITDSLAGDKTENKIAAGPKSVEVKLEKKNLLGTYDLHSLATVNLTENYWTSDGSKITDNSKQTSNKYSTFSFTPDANLSLGNYKITLTGKDKADNTGGATSFNLSVTTFARLVTPEEEKIIEKTIEEELPEATKEEKEKIKEELEIVKPMPPKEISFLERIASKLANLTAKIYWQIVEGTKVVLAFGKKTVNALAYGWGKYSQFTRETNKKTLAFVGKQIQKATTSAGITIVKSYDVIAQKAPGGIGETMLALKDTTGQTGKQITAVFGSSSKSIAQAIKIATEKTSQTVSSVTSQVASAIANMATPIGNKAVKFAQNTQLWFAITSEIYLDKEPTKIVEVKVLEIGETYALVYWRTNHHTKNNKVNYGEDRSYGNSTFAKDREREHTVRITNLEPNTKYVFEVMSQNKNYIYDSFHEFTTLP